VAATDEAGAAAQARAIVQQPKSKAYEEVDDLHRSALHLAALKGYHLLAEALLSAPSDVRSIMVNNPRPNILFPPSAWCTKLYPR
jgi:hypothetical protein